MRLNVWDDARLGAFYLHDVTETGVGVGRDVKVLAKTLRKRDDSAALKSHERDPRRVDVSHWRPSEAGAAEGAAKGNSCP